MSIFTNLRNTFKLFYSQVVVFYQFDELFATNWKFSCGIYNLLRKRKWYTCHVHLFSIFVIISTPPMRDLFINFVQKISWHQSLTLFDFFNGEKSVFLNDKIYQLFQGVLNIFLVQSIDILPDIFQFGNQIFFDIWLIFCLCDKKN